MSVGPVKQPRSWVTNDKTMTKQLLPVHFRNNNSKENEKKITRTIAKLLVLLENAKKKKKKMKIANFFALHANPTRIAIAKLFALRVNVIKKDNNKRIIK